MGVADPARELRGIADRHASGRIVFLLEGGYNPGKTAEAAAGVLAVIGGFRMYGMLFDAAMSWEGSVPRE